MRNPRKPQPDAPETGELHLRSLTSIIRQANGKARWVSISCTNVKNRVGEIDSRALFESMVEYAYRTGEFPYRTIWHLGEMFRTGQADFLASDGYLYLSSGEFDNSPLAEIELAARANAPQDFFGESIRYASLAPPTIISDGKGGTIRVYTNGVNIEISSLPEVDAAAPFTQTNMLGGLNAMKDKTKQSLMDIAERAGGDAQDVMRAVIENFESVNRAIEEGELAGDIITRADPAPTADTPAPTAQATDAQAADSTASAVTIDAESINAIVEGLIGHDGFWAAIDERIYTVLDELLYGAQDQPADGADMMASQEAREGDGEQARSLNEALNEAIGLHVEALTMPVLQTINDRLTALTERLSQRTTTPASNDKKRESRTLVFRPRASEDEDAEEVEDESELTLAHVARNTMEQIRAEREERGTL